MRVPKSILSGCIAIWMVEPLPPAHVAIFDGCIERKPAMIVPQKHEWTVERVKKNRKGRRKSQ